MSYSLNYTKILLSALTIAFVSALVFGGTQAFFNDEETSEGNLFTAGALDLLVDSEAHYAGLYCNEEGVWELEAEETTRPDLEGEDCDGTWTETDLGPTHKFFNLGDLKPGDEGENTISLHVENNDAYACVIIDNMQDDDNGLTEPEENDAGDTTGGAGEGELSSELRFFAWADNGGAEAGNNIWEAGEPILFSNEEGPASDVIDGVVYPLFTPETGPLPGAVTQYIGLYWCYGNIDVDEGTNTLTCDGEGGTNLTQTDSLKADFTFYVEQARNNEEFTCPVLDDEEPVDGPLVGAVLGDYAAPLECDATVEGAESIQTEVNGVSENGTVCVADSYDQSGDSSAVRIETVGVTLAAVTRGKDLDVPVVLSADGVTVTGFTGLIGQAESPAEQAAFYLDNDATNATLSFNDVSGGVGAAILTETGATLGGGLIANNTLSGATQGIYLNPHTGNIVIEYNDIDDNVAGIAGLNGATVRFNEFEHAGAAAEAIGADSTFDANPATVNFNNFLDDTRVNIYPVVTATVDLQNNFFGPNGAAAQTDDSGGPIDIVPEAVSAFTHNS